MVVSAPRRQEGNLPAEVTSFVGRRRETSETRRLLAEARLVTLTGPGGVGKSRLALHVAARVRRGFPDGVWLVDLAALDEPQLLAQTVLDTLGVRDASSRPASDALAAFLADRSLLLVLDNCEHLLDECAELAATLSRAAPGLRMLATSREALRIEGEHALLVPPLPVPDAPPEVSGDNGQRAPTTKELVGCDAVALFADRAGAAVPDFA